MAQEFSELSWWVAHAQNCRVGGEEWAIHTMGVAPACQGHTALHFPAQSPPDSCAAEAIAAGRTAQPAQSGVQSPPGAVAHPQSIRVWGILDPHRQPLRTEMHWPTQRRNIWGAFPVPSQPPGSLCAAPKAQTCSFKALALCSQRLEPLQGGRNAEAVNPSLAHRTSGCCRLPLLLLKTFAGVDPSRCPCR